MLCLSLLYQSLEQSAAPHLFSPCPTQRIQKLVTHIVRHCVGDRNGKTRRQICYFVGKEARKEYYRLLLFMNTSQPNEKLEHKETQKQHCQKDQQIEILDVDT